MLRRCYDPAAESYKHYGARGISVCDRWRFGEDGMSGLDCYVLDMGLPPFEGASVDRIDNNGNYEPSNCRWATVSQQNRNTRRSMKVITDEGWVAVVDIAERAGVNPATARNRFKRGHRQAETIAAEVIRPKGSSHCRAKLTEADVKNMRAAWEAGKDQGAIARAFGVSQQTVSRIVTRAGWAHVT